MFLEIVVKRPQNVETKSRKQKRKGKFNRESKKEGKIKTLSEK